MGKRDWLIVQVSQFPPMEGPSAFDAPMLSGKYSMNAVHRFLQIVYCKGDLSNDEAIAFIRSKGGIITVCEREAE